MIPLRDSVPSRTRPVVVFALLAVNVVVFAYQLWLGPSLEEFIFGWGFVPAEFTGWTAHHPDRPPWDPLRFVPLVTSMFLHASWLHVGANLLFLWVFGDNVEDRLGHLRFVLFYLLCGIGATAAHTLAHPDSPLPTVGASGAVSGVLGAYMLLYPRARVLTLIPIIIIPWIVSLPAAVFLGLWFLIQLFSGLLVLRDGMESAGGVAWWAHAGGFLSGMLLCVILRRGKVRRW